MNVTDSRYKNSVLVQEMLQTPQIIRGLDPGKIQSFSVNKQKVLLAGEGSSRIFPAKNTICNSLVPGYSQRIITENCMQAAEYDLSDYSVFVASNSGRTSEVIHLIRSLREKGHSDITAVTGTRGTPVALESSAAYILTCGAEQAVSANKSVMEQALFYDILFRHINGEPPLDLELLADAMHQVLTMDIPQEIVAMTAAAPVLYFSGRNNGVAEELALKTNEIVRKKSDYLEGTYAVHGVEEVMNKGEVVILFDPFESQEEKIRSVIVEGAGLSVIAVSERETVFPTIRIPHIYGCAPYLQLAIGWNLLVEAGIASGINPDCPVRARKIGNEFTGLTNHEPELKNS
ncbi:MAG TPA: sugar isomerase [Spirochaetota bacterium]|nr:sugar isomerase [Spirochaetota bacterium]